MVLARNPKLEFSQPNFIQGVSVYEHVLVYYKDQRHPTFRKLDDELDAGDIIPGFTLPIKDILSSKN